MNKVVAKEVITDDTTAPCSQEESEMILVDPDLDDDSNMILDPDLDDSNSAAAIHQISSVSEEEEIESSKIIKSAMPIVQKSDDINDNNSRISLEENCQKKINSIAIDSNVFIDTNPDNPTSVAQVEVKSISPINENTVVLIHGVDKSVDFCPNCQKRLCPFKGAYTLNVVTYDVNVVCNGCSKTVVIKDLFTERQKALVWNDTKV